MTASAILYPLEPNVSFFEAMISDMCGRLAQGLGLRSVASEPSGEGFTLLPIEGVTPDDCPAVRVYVREQDKHSNDYAPSVCCVPVGGPIVPPDTNGSQQVVLNGKRVSFQVVRDRLFTTRVTLWGETRGQAETLLGQTILAFQGFHNMVEFSEELWDDQQDGQGGQMTSGAMISFAVQIRIAVTDLPARLVRIHKVKAIVTELDQTEVVKAP